MSLAGYMESQKSQMQLSTRVCSHTHTHVGGLSNREIFSHGLEAGCPQSRCQQGWVSLRPLSSSRRQPSSPCVLTGPSLCSGVRVLISSSLKDTILVGQSPPWWPHLTSSPLWRPPPPRTVAFWGPGVENFNKHVLFRDGDAFQSITLTVQLQPLSMWP